MPPFPIRNILQRLELPRCHRTRANVSHLPALYHVIQRLHDFFSWRISVQAMDLQNVNICAQSRDTRIHRIEDVLSRQALTVDHIAVIGRGLVDGTADVAFVDAEEAF
jgi:hypothetical protein